MRAEGPTPRTPRECASVRVQGVLPAAAACASRGSERQSPATPLSRSRKGPKDARPHCSVLLTALASAAEGAALLTSRPCPTTNHLTAAWGQGCCLGPCTKVWTRAGAWPQTRAPIKSADVGSRWWWEHVLGAGPQSPQHSWRLRLLHSLFHPLFHSYNLPTCFHHPACRPTSPGPLGANAIVF